MNDYDSFLARYLQAGGQRPTESWYADGGAGAGGDGAYDPNQGSRYAGSQPVDIGDGLLANMDPSGNLNIAYRSNEGGVDGFTNVRINTDGTRETPNWNENRDDLWVNSLAGALGVVALPFIVPFLAEWAGATATTEAVGTDVMGEFIATLPESGTASAGATGLDAAAMDEAFNGTNLLNSAGQPLPPVSATPPVLDVNGVGNSTPVPEPSAMGPDSIHNVPIPGTAPTPSGGPVPSINVNGATPAPTPTTGTNPPIVSAPGSANGQWDILPPAVNPGSTSSPTTTSPGTNPQGGSRSLIDRLLDGSLSAGDLATLLSGVTGAANRYNYGQALLDRAADATPNRTFYEGQLRQTYEDPGAYLRGPEVSAAMDITHNKLQRSDAARGTLANDTGRQVTLQNQALGNLGNYRQGLSQTVAQNQSTYSGNNELFRQGAAADNTWTQSILNALLTQR